MEDFDLTQEQVANRVGKSRSAVTNTLRLFQLPPSVQKLVAERKLSAGHARALLGSPDRLFQETLARRAVAEELSVRELEELVREHVEARPGADRRWCREPARRRRYARPACWSSRSCCPPTWTPGSRCRMGAKRGRVVVEFATVEDLERIYRAMTTGREADDVNLVTTVRDDNRDRPISSTTCGQTCG